MSIDSDRRIATAQLLSALADGEIDAAGVAKLSADWRDDAQARTCWHSYQLIGDILRSDDLASTASHDSDFLAKLRTRMADEPVVLAPQPLPRQLPDRTSALDVRASVASGRLRRGNRFWIATSAVAAGFVMVVGASLSLRPAGDAPSQITQAGWQQAAAGAGAIEAVSVGALRDRPEPSPVLANANLIRDARLDRYLAAHKQFSGSSVLGVPSGFLRDSATDAPTR